MLEQAIRMAINAHQRQVDKAGEAYILHPLRVMLVARDAGLDENGQIAAVLHDVVEDGDVPITDIGDSFGPIVAGLVDTLTRRRGEPYQEYIARVIADGAEARQIKLIDLMDNLRRIPALHKIDSVMATRLLNKYHIGLRQLKEAGCLTQ